MKTTANGISLFYEVSGTGSPLLLLHGNGEDHHIFDKVAEKLAARYTVYALDSRNHGQSEKTTDYSYGTMAEDVSAFIATLHLGKVSLIGFSDGAIISLLLAQRHEDAVDRMALLGINLKPTDFTDENYQYIKDTYEETKDPLFKLMLEEPNIELDSLRSVSVPTLVIAAEHDLYRSQMFAELVAALPHAELKVMEGHDHGSYIIGQDILYDTFRDFFH